VTICPCCGFKFEGEMSNGCEGCGARSVGEPLPRPEFELPAYGRSLLLVVTGTLMVLGLLVETIAALVERLPISFGFWSWVAAGETAAWRLKWIAIPVSFLVLLCGRQIYRSIMARPSHFVGINAARRGLLASAIVSLLIATLIGVTVPARLRQRQDGIEAASNARLHTIERAQLQYFALHGRIPSSNNIKDDLLDLPDPDGSIAAALKDIDPSFYKTSSDVAAVATTRRPLSAVAVRNVSLTTASEEPPAAGLSPTNYELRDAGEDKIYGTDDDLILRDGVIYTLTQAKEAPISVRAPVRPGKR
jgi:hypothetical protein